MTVNQIDFVQGTRRGPPVGVPGEEHPAVVVPDDGHGADNRIARSGTIYQPGIGPPGQPSRDAEAVRRRLSFPWYAGHDTGDNVGNGLHARGGRGYASCAASTRGSRALGNRSHGCPLAQQNNGPGGPAVSCRCRGPYDFCARSYAATDVSRHLRCGRCWKWSPTPRRESLHGCPFDGLVLSYRTIPVAHCRDRVAPAHGFPI